MRSPFFLFLSVSLFFSCQQNTKSKQSSEIPSELSQENHESFSLKKESPEYQEEAYTHNPDSTMLFSHAFIYRYANSDNPDDAEQNGEFWIYHDPETGNLLFDPQDEMVDYVISDPEGNYYFFGTDGHGQNTVSKQYVDWVSDSEYDEKETYPLSDENIKFSKTGQKLKVKEGGWNGKPIVGTEYLWEFQRVSGPQRTAVTEQFPINYYQVYGFNKLEGDVLLPVLFLDFTGIFGKNQTVTHFESGPLQLELITYEYNPYYAQIAEYEYYIYEGEGNWRKEKLPLLPK